MKMKYETNFRCCQYPHSKQRGEWGKEEEGEEEGKDEDRRSEKTARLFLLDTEYSP